MRWLLALALGCAQPGPQIYRCHQTSVCDDVPSDEGWGDICSDDIDRDGRAAAKQCADWLLGWCTWWSCSLQCEPTGQVCQVDEP